MCVFAASHQLQKFFLYENLGKYSQNTVCYFCIFMKFVFSCFGYVKSITRTSTQSV